MRWTLLKVEVIVEVFPDDAESSQTLTLDITSDAAHDTDLTEYIRERIVEEVEK